MPASHSLIAPAAWQEVLDSARNAGQRGPAEFYTPADFARDCAAPLNPHRFEICDLNCGDGALLTATANQHTKTLLGLDIAPSGMRAPKSAGRHAADPVPANPQSAIPNPHWIQGDLTLVAPLLDDVGWRCHIFALNPPWGLLWDRERLAHLGRSDLPAVANAFAALSTSGASQPLNSPTPKLPTCIDSTLATLMLALHHVSDYGEGYLIANHATLERLVFGPGAPAAMLAVHVWARVTVEGNPMTGLQGNAWQDTMQVDVIWFARGHTEGPRYEAAAATPADWKQSIKVLTEERWRYRQGPELRRFMEAEAGLGDWLAVAEEWRAQRKSDRRDWNLWLDSEGRIGVHLSVFDTTAASRRLGRDASELARLKGRTPMQLVVQRSWRDALVRAAGPQSPWRVDPSLRQAVEQAVRDYHAARAPIYPLPAVQRLGYLDEEDTILCTRDLPANSLPELRSPNSDLLFRAGERYALSTWTTQVVRKGERPNLQGEMERLEFTGQDLVICVETKPDHGGAGVGNHRRIAFVDPRMLTGDTEARDLGTGRRQVDATLALTLLLNHFEIPDVPDVSAVNPDLFIDHLASLDGTEQLLGL